MVPAPGPSRRRHVGVGVLLVAAAYIGVTLVAGALLGSKAPRIRNEPARGSHVSGQPGRTGPDGVAPPGAARPASPFQATGRQWHVFAAAKAGGDGSPTHPFGGIAEALKEAQAGDVVTVGPGTYGGFATVRAGKADAPISIVGSSAAIRGGGKGHLVEILHDHVTVQGFDISRADPPVHVFHASGVRIADNVIHDAGGECVRIKYRSSDNEVTGNRISRCGLDFDTSDGHKNGEGVYIGTAPEQLRRNPTGERDASNDNWIHDNVITSPAECVDIKEGASGNRVENNVCTGGKDPDGAGFSARGDGNFFRDNTSSGHKGAGIRLGGDKKDDGLDNVVVGNHFTGNRGLGVKVEREPQAQICGNEVSDNDKVTNGEADPRSTC
jgi:hypothetical protein